jgi:hypothetical protein
VGEEVRSDREGPEFIVIVQCTVLQSYKYMGNLMDGIHVARRSLMGVSLLLVCHPDIDMSVDCELNCQLAGASTLECFSEAFL